MNASLLPFGSKHVLGPPFPPRPSARQSTLIDIVAIKTREDLGLRPLVCAALVDAGLQLLEPFQGRFAAGKSFELARLAFLRNSVPVDVIQA